jgi:hypothetical protein
VEANIKYKVQIDFLACKTNKDFLHVQGLSFWAPANIGLILFNLDLIRKLAKL